MTEEVRIIVEGIPGPPGAGVARAKGRVDDAVTFTPAVGIPFKGAPVGVAGVDLRRFELSEYFESEGGAYDGVTDCSAAVAAWSAAAVAAGEHGVISGPVYVASDVTIECDVEITPKGRIKRAAAATVTITGKTTVSPTTWAFDSSLASVGSAGKFVLAEGTMAEIVPTNFGAVGDAVLTGVAPTGSAMGTDNSVALWSLREATRAWSNVTIRFTPGTYAHRLPAWFRGYGGTVVIEGSGARLVNFNEWPTDSASKFDSRGSVLNGAGCYNTYGYDDTTIAAETTQRGYLIDSAEPGDDGITLSSAGDASNFYVGQHVLLEGFARQASSNPPNPVYYEYHTVAAVSGADVTFDRPVEYSYNSAWYDCTADTISGGAPRLTPLDRSNIAFTEHLTVRNLHFVEKPTWDDGDGHVNGALGFSNCEHITLEHVTAGYCAPSVCDQIVMSDCSFTNLEIDKIINVCRIERTYLDSISGTTGVNFLDIEGGGCKGVLQLESENIRLRDWRVTQGPDATSTHHAISVAASRHVESLVVERCRVGTELIPGTANDEGLITGGVEKSFTVASVSSAQKVLATYATDTDVANIQASLRIGSLIMDATDPKLCGRVTDIYREDATNLAIEATFTALPTVGQVFRWSTLTRRDVDAQQVAGPARVAKVESFNRAREGRLRTNASIERLVLGPDDFNVPTSGSAMARWPLEVFDASLVSIWCRVWTAYSGAGLPAVSQNSNDTSIWAGTRCTPSVVDANIALLTDVAEGSPTGHWIANTITNATSGTETTTTIWIKPGTKTWAFVQFGGAGGTSGAVVYLDLTNLVAGVSSASPGTSGTPVGLASATYVSTDGGTGLQRWDCSGIQQGGSLIIGPANGDGAGVYTADGLGTINVGRGATFGPVTTQDTKPRISVVDDVSGEMIAGFDLETAGSRRVDEFAVFAGATDLVNGLAGDDVAVQPLDGAFLAKCGIQWHAAGLIPPFADYTDHGLWQIMIEYARPR